MGGRRENNQGKMSRGKKFTLFFKEYLRSLMRKLSNAAYGVDYESYLFSNRKVKNFRSLAEMLS